ncbi:TPA: hypothetical protein U1B15_000197 [Streptococcus suis]|nr:hypothetical protein [Streptococcus suis]HEM3450154.1 hypothetical protein [Streptococcus suis]HEM3497773.1 hypothetical protein [Streptococcus suis]
MTDDLKQKMDGIYGWSVDGDKIQPPIHRFPKAVKDRADYFAEKTESNIIQLNLKEIKHSVTVFNPLLEISKLPFDEAKELMWKAYHHRLTEDEYALMPILNSPVDFKKMAENKTEITKWWRI